MLNCKLIIALFSIVFIGCQSSQIEEYPHALYLQSNSDTIPMQLINFKSIVYDTTPIFLNKFTSPELGNTNNYDSRHDYIIALEYPIEIIKNGVRLSNGQEYKMMIVEPEDNSPMMLMAPNQSPVWRDTSFYQK